MELLRKLAFDNPFGVLIVLGAYVIQDPCTYYMKLTSKNSKSAHDLSSSRTIVPNTIEARAFFACCHNLLDEKI